MTQNTRCRFHRVMSIAEARGLSPEMLRQLRAQGVLPPMAGAEHVPGSGNPGGEGGGTPPPTAKTGDDDDDDDDDDADDDEDDDEGAPAPKGKKKSTKNPAPTDDEDEFVRMPRSEVQRLRREARDARKREQQREVDERVRREKDLADQEKWKDLAASREDRITEIEGQMEALKMEGQKNQRKANIVKVAKRLSFEYPEDAHRFLDVEDMEDEQSIESALNAVLRDRPKLKSRRRGSGAPIPGEREENGKGGALTVEDIQKMSPEEINKRWPEVQAVLRSQEAAAS